MADFRKRALACDTGSFHTALDSNSSTPLEMPGVERWYYTKFGPAKARYMKCVQSGGCARGELQSYRAAAAISNFTSGSTTTAVTSGLTANDYQYDLLIIHDDSGGAGADPEGSCAPITKNTTTTIYLDPENPLSAAVGSNDDGTVCSFCKCEDAAAADEVNEVCGVALTTITENYWGWFQYDGICPYVLVKASTALTAAKALIADTARVSVSSTSGDQLLIGIPIAQVGCSNDLSSDVWACQLDNLGHARGVSA